MAIEYMTGTVVKLGKVVEGTSKANKPYKIWRFDLLDASGNVVSFSGFGKRPIEIETAYNHHEDSVPMELEVSFVVSGEYKNFKGVKVVSDTCPPVKNVIDKSIKPDFKQALDCTVIDFLAGEAAMICKAAKKEFVEVFGREPASDGDMTTINTMQIFIGKCEPVQAFKRSKLGLTIEELTRRK